MLFKEQISLVTITDADTSLAVAIAAGTKTLVFADKKSVKQNEFYAAAAAGLNPEVVFVVRTADYTGQTCVLWTNPYKVIRTFERDDEMTELVCERV